MQGVLERGQASELVLQPCLGRLQALHRAEEVFLPCLQKLLQVLGILSNTAPIPVGRRQLIGVLLLTPGPLRHSQVLAQFRTSRRRITSLTRKGGHCLFHGFLHSSGSRIQTYVCVKRIQDLLPLNFCIASFFSVLVQRGRDLARQLCIEAPCQSEASRPSTALFGSCKQSLLQLCLVAQRLDTHELQASSQDTLGLLADVRAVVFIWLLRKQRFEVTDELCQ
mmetsp:Transcript_119282/g.167744  ORF Transcript_119282/g.167744 Transcript_119282/m.167744 type:complete len:223 (-) Transcript_119282:467-1135(-)